YTEAVLKKNDQWSKLQDYFVFAKDVRQVLAYVESGNADIGFVYESDAESSADIEVIAKADLEDHDPIIYPGANVVTSEHQAEATLFLDFLLSDQGQDILKKYGFSKS